MNLLSTLHASFLDYLTDQLGASKAQAKACSFALNTDNQKQQFGDIATNAAMILAKTLYKNSRIIADDIAKNFKNPALSKIEVAGPGFLNFFLTKEAFAQLAQELFQQKDRFFKSTYKPNQRINIEFVSANPTGPLHFGHGRGGIIGDVLGNVLRFLGYDVTKEFYINDAGAQIRKLGQSLKIRYQQVAGMIVNLPEDAYHGTYLIDIAHNLFAEHGNKLLDQPDEFFSSYAMKKLLEQIQNSLHDYGITFDEWFSEKTLHEGEIEQTLAVLQHKGVLYEKDGALWFASTQFGDDKDRVVKKQDGSLTYAAADSAYMQNKINRGYDQLVYVLGHDHHSYATRLRSIRAALGLEAHPPTLKLRRTGPLNVILYQLVSMKEGEEQVRMSKRQGKIVTLQDIIDTVGKDIARFFYLNRKADAQLEFDLDLALKHTDENPAFYIQYAYVRTGSIIEKAQEIRELKAIKASDLPGLATEDELLIKQLAALKEILETIEQNHQTHLLAYYTYDLAQQFNRYYSKHKVINAGNIPLSRARLALTQIVRTTLGLCLDLLGISKPERM